MSAKYHRASETHGYYIVKIMHIQFNIGIVNKGYMNTLNKSKSVAGPDRFLQVNVLKLEYGNLEYPAYIDVN